MNRLRNALFAPAIVAAILASGPSLAEVSAETDALGNYVRTVVLTNASVRNLRVWAVQRLKTNFHPLNADGDLNGDLWPMIEDQPVGERKPWVVWSRWNGTDLDLAWSFFRDGAWIPTAWVESGTTRGQDDLDPDIAFDADGRAHIVWWRNENGQGRVYLSIYLVSRFMTAFPVSDAGIDSVYPQVNVRPDGKIEVSYETPSGRVVRVVTFARPTTITDDVTPFGRMNVTQESGSKSLTN